tara:strand:- start:2213 stop:2932 length:720 start_codon:yes stop_codon:yes gene_type:complete
VTNHKEETNKLFLFKKNTLATNFPDINEALIEPDGLVALGGDLSVKRLLDAYSHGIFPWFNKDQPILWWSPDPRCILKPSELRVSRSLAKVLKKDKFNVTFNTVFIDVVNGCAAARNGKDDTWITDDIKLAYLNLFKMGYAHSVECWYGEKLVGGLYGLAMGKVFFGESMFSKVSNASKIALLVLSRNLQSMNFKIIDCQVHSRHLQMLGAKTIQRSLFRKILEQYCSYEKVEYWQLTA